MPAVVYLIDDDDQFRRSLGRLLRVSGYRVADYESAHHFLRECEPNKRGCILLDVAMQQPDGLVFQERLKELDIPLPIIFVSGSVDIRQSVRAMKAGAEDFLCKPVSRSDLVHAIDRALQRNKEWLEQRAKQEELRTSFDRLTPREKEVFELVCVGKLNKQIAQELNITVRTVKAHRQKVMEKLQVRSVTELVTLSFSLLAALSASTVLSSFARP